MNGSSDVPGAGDSRTNDASLSTAAGWSLAHRLSFRFVFVFTLLLALPFPLGHLPSGFIPFPAYNKMWLWVSAWVGKHVFHIAFSPSEFLLDDAASGYVVLFCFVITAIVAAILWTLLDRRRKDYRSLHDCLRIYVRYMLGFTMFVYGLNKVYALQFWPMDLYHLSIPLGAYSRSDFLWGFMGFSTAYTVFVGSVETLGALLLFFRRTTALGALILCGSLANVVMLNFCYGVSVKLFSSALLFLAVFLVAPEIMRLVNIFLLNQATTSTNLESPFRASWMKFPRIAMTAAFIVFSLYWISVPGLQPNRKVKYAPKPVLYGLYQVESFTQDGKPIPQNDSNWRRVIFEKWPWNMIVITMDDTVNGYHPEYDAAKSTVAISRDRLTSVLTYSRPDPDHLELRGNLENHPVVITMRKVDPRKFDLVSEKFQWAMDD